jgi:Domain of unknown function (DUF5658)
MGVRKLAGNIAVTCFITMQVADWIATYQGVILFGTEIEANPLLRFLMERYDIILTLTSAKLAATSAGLLLHLLNRHLAVASLTLLYTVFGFVPWLRALSLMPIF